MRSRACRVEARVPESSRGIALVAVLVMAVLVGSIALGLSLVVATDLVALHNERDSTTLRYAAEGALEVAARELSRASSWDDVLSGAERSALADGPPMGTRAIGTWRVDLDAQTNLLNCGRRAACTAAQMAAVTPLRPWGADNPHWRPFLYGPLASLAPFSQAPPVYLVVWLADDARETDGNPARDATAPEAPGRGVLRARADAFGERGSRRSVEAELVRVCRIHGGVETCLPGIRVQSWRDVRQAVP